MHAEAFLLPVGPPPPIALPAADVPCCPPAVHMRMKASTRAWRRAHLVGYQIARPATHLYEMRICPVCGSSMVRRIVIVVLRYVRAPRLTAPRLAPKRVVRAQAAAGAS